MEKMQNWKNHPAETSFLIQLIQFSKLPQIEEWTLPLCSSRRDGRKFIYI